MSPFRILAAATAAEICLACAMAAILGLGGAVNGWLDLFNCLAPLLIAAGLGGAAVAAAAWAKGRFRTLCVAAGLFAALYGVAASLPDVAGWLSSLGGGKGVPYRVVTANVYRNNRNPIHGVLAVLARRADAVIVEEGNGDFQAARPFLARAYRYSTTCPDAEVQIWLKTPILAQGCGMTMPSGAYWTWGRDFAWARTVGPDGRPITLAGVHLGRPYPPRRQPIERQALAGALAPMAGSRVLAAGDLNMAPWSFGMRQMDRLLRPLTRRTFWLPTYPALIGMTHKPWPVPFLPIDHVYADSGWARAKAASFPIPGSDHFGVQVDAQLH